MPLDHGNQRSHGRLRLPWRTLLLGLLAILAYILLGPAPEAWVVSREALHQREWWTLISGHWMHSDRQHAVWNIAALLILGGLFEYHLKQRIFAELLLSSLLLSLWINWYMPELQAYCGLSGILNTLLVTGTIAVWQHYRSNALLLILILALIKSLIELFSHQAIFTHTLWPSVPEAHLVGMSIGLLLVLTRSGCQRVMMPMLNAAKHG
jgi:rhomboid family GlyGly-CTERM serine protease